MSKKFHNVFLAFGLFVILLVFTIFPARQMVEAATLNIVSDKSTLSIGDQFNVDIKIDSENVGVNAAQATLQYSRDLVSIVKVDKTGSVFNFWLVEPEFNNETGELAFIGGSTSGFSGKSLQILEVTFKVKGTGTVNLTFNDSAVTASDGSGTNILSASHGLAIKSLSQTDILTIQSPQIQREPEAATGTPKKPIIIVPLYPSPDKWHSVISNFSASWNLPRDITGVAAVLNKVPASQPATSGGLFDNKSFDALDNGIWYLHVRFKNKIGWGATAHYKIAIDTVPPSTFKVDVYSDVPDNPSPEIKFDSKDQFSGIDYYLIAIDNDLPAKTDKSPFTPQPIAPGKHTVKVTALDKAGNATESQAEFEIVPLPSPTIASISRDVYVGEGNLAVSGLSSPEFTIVIDLKDQKEQTIFETTIPVKENGFWSLSIDQLLKKGTYHVEVLAKDSRGAMSFPVVSDEIVLRERPILTIAGFGLTYKWFVVALVILLVGSFILGFVTRQLAKQSRQKRILIAERDVNAQLTNIKKDIEMILEEYKDESKPLDHSVKTKVNFVLKKINTNIKKNTAYILENIEEIE